MGGNEKQSEVSRAVERPTLPYSASQRDENEIHGLMDESIKTEYQEYLREKSLFSWVRYLLMVLGAFVATFMLVIVLRSGDSSSDGVLSTVDNIPISSIDDTKPFISSIPSKLPTLSKPTMLYGSAGSSASGKQQQQQFEKIKLLQTKPLPNVVTGENTVWYGPFTFPKAALVTSFVARANLTFVHHLVVYKNGLATGKPPGWVRTSRLPHGVLGDNNILFAWARTGQTVPIRFNADAGTGSFIGPRSDAVEIYFNVHFEIPKEVAAASRKSEVVVDVGLEIGYNEFVDDDAAVMMARCSASDALFAFRADPSSECAKQPMGLGVDILNQWHLNLPPGKEDVDVTFRCRVQHDVTLIAYRNHGHSAGRQWTTFLIRDGVRTGAILDRSVQDAQIFYKFNRSVTLRKDDELELHCHFNTMGRTHFTEVGADLSKEEEMCNQYLMYYPTPLFAEHKMCMSLGNNAKHYLERHFSVDVGFTSKPFMSPEELGQVAAVASTPSGDTVFVLARRDNNFFSKKRIAKPTIFALDVSSGEVLRTFGEDLLSTPHGLHCDSTGKHLWVTDTSLHQVFKLDAETGEVLLTMGQAWFAAHDEASFNQPTDVAVDISTNEVYVSDGYGNCRVVVFDATTGAFKREWGGGPEARGSDPGQFDIVHNLALDPVRDVVYVADRDNCRLQVFHKSNGTLVAAWPRSELCASEDDLRVMTTPYLTHLSAVAYSATLDVLFTVEGEFLAMRRPDSGELVDKWGDEGQFIWPHDVDLGVAQSLPQVYLAALDGNRVHRIKLGDLHSVSPEDGV